MKQEIIKLIKQYQWDSKNRDKEATKIARQILAELDKISDQAAMIICQWNNKEINGNEAMHQIAKRVNWLPQWERYMGYPSKDIPKNKVGKRIFRNEADIQKYVQMFLNGKIANTRELGGYLGMSHQGAINILYKRCPNWKELVRRHTRHRKDEDRFLDPEKNRQLNEYRNASPAARQKMAKKEPLLSLFI